MEVVTENLTLLANTLGLKESLGQLDLQAVSLQFGNIILGRPDFSLCLFIYTLVCVSAITKVLKPLKNFWLHDVVYCILAAFGGGGVLLPIIFHEHTPILINERLVVSALVCYLLCTRCPFDLVNKIMDVYPVKVVLRFYTEVCRLNVARLWIDYSMVHLLSGTKLASWTFFSFPVVGPIIVGTIAGCGGCFIPLDVGIGGLTILKKRAIWGIQKAFFVAAAYHLLMYGMEIKADNAYLSLFTHDIDGVGGMVISACILAATVIECLQDFISPNFNPLYPVYKVLYLVTGVAEGESATAVTQKKKVSASNASSSAVAAAKANKNQPSKGSKDNKGKNNNRNRKGSKGKRN